MLSVDLEKCIQCSQTRKESELQISFLNFPFSYPISTNNDSIFFKKHVNEGLIPKIVLSDNIYQPKIAFSHKKR